MRLFAALLPPPEALAEVERAVAPYRTVYEGLRWPAPETWHITLAFFGEVPEAVLPELSARLARAAARHPAARLALAGAGAFPTAGRARVLWMGVTGDPLTRLADSVKAAARRVGVEPADSRRYHPHLTLARAKYESDLSSLADSLAAFEGSAWEARAVHLVRSHLGPVVRHESLAHWALLPPRVG